MANKLNDSSSDWTSGLIAIFSALMIGVGIPVAVYLLFYTRKLEEREAKGKEIEAVDVQLDEARKERTRIDETLLKGDNVLWKLHSDFEKNFTKPSESAVGQAIAALTNDYRITVPEARKDEVGVETVIVTGKTYQFENGLEGEAVVVQGGAKFHDFGAFLTKLETLENYTILQDKLTILGDQNGDDEHYFELFLVVLKRRALERDYNGDQPIKEPPGSIDENGPGKSAPKGGNEGKDSNNPSKP